MTSIWILRVFSTTAGPNSGPNIYCTRPTFFDLNLKSIYIAITDSQLEIFRTISIGLGICIELREIILSHLKSRFKKCLFKYVFYAFYSYVCEILQ